MRFLPRLFERNRAWAAAQTAPDPLFFERLCAIQSPEYLWIGCADSRVPANEIVGLRPGELFVHRNVGNVVYAGDANALSVLQYAVETLRVKHVIVCGHYGCGGVRAATGPPVDQPLETWLSSIRETRDRHREALESLDEASRWRRLCELNVIRQVETLRSVPIVLEAWRRGQALVLHGWIYDLRDGLLRDLEISADHPD